MKKIFFSLLIVSMAVAVQAQDMKHRRHDNMKDHKGMMAHKLNLSEEQKAKAKTYHEDFRTKMADLKKNDNITVKEWRSKMETLRKDHKAKIQGLLTNDQKSQIEKMKTDRKAMHEIDSKSRMEKMKMKLGLSDDQASKLSKNRTEMMEKMKAIRENKNLDDLKKKEQVKELMKQQKEKTKSVLTEEQLKKLKEQKSHRHQRQPV
jgi:hypothetical protein